MEGNEHSKELKWYAVKLIHCIACMEQVKRRTADVDEAEPEKVLSGERAEITLSMETFSN